MRTLPIVLIALMLPMSALAQPDLAPLRAAVGKARSDTARVNALNALAQAQAEFAPDSAIALATQALELAQRVGFVAGEAEALKNIGFGHEGTESFVPARSYYERAFALWSTQGNKAKLGELHRRMGDVAELQGDKTEALKQFLAALRIQEAARDTPAIADLKSAIGNVQNELGNGEQAVALQREALALFEALHDTLGAARVSNNLGTILDGLGRYEEGLTYLTHALDMARMMGHPYGESICMASIANHYQAMGDLERALDYNLRSLPLVEQNGSPYNEAALHINIGEILTGLKRYDEARQHLEKGVELAASMGAMQWLSNAHAGLYDLAQAVGDPDEALKHFILHIDYRDSIRNEANTRKAVQEQMQYEFEKKEAVAQAEHEEELRRQKLVRNGVMGGLAFALLFLGVVWQQRNRINTARKRSDELLLNILPEEVAEELKATGAAEARHFETATILFTDFKGFTQLSEQVTPAELVEELNACFKVFDGIMGRYRIEKIKTIGDAYMAAGGLPDPQHGSPADVVRAALDMQDFMKRHKAERQAAGKPYFEMRVGIHTGPVVAGIVGVKKFQYDIWGDTVNTASRMESSGEVGQVNISEATYALVKDASTPLGTPAFTFTSRGKVQAKGKGEMEMFFVHRSSEGA